mmetsp:Transcript_3223/g.5669  ORF Transcript_3223/g.5669 Transcript_3223/m.5669 type:complete len:106 (-) Transcript_3223:642-959(-)
MSKPSTSADAAAGDLMGVLLHNAEIMRDDSSSQSPSPCQVECHAQQKAILQCVESIRKSREEEGEMAVVVSSKEASLSLSCLSPAVAAWTSCCATANERGAVSGD